MSEAPLRSFVEKCSILADNIFKPDAQMLAYFLAENREGKPHLIVCPMANVREELQFRCGTPLLLRQNGFKRWCFFTEAWSATDCIPGGILPADRPDRMEVVIFAAEELASQAPMMASRQIYRPTDGPARLMPLVFARERAGFVMGLPPTAVGARP